jgi:hypothetical protein
MLLSTAQLSAVTDLVPDGCDLRCPPSDNAWITLRQCRFVGSQLLFVS